jgi:hypothetical protein
VEEKQWSEHDRCEPLKKIDKIAGYTYLEEYLAGNAGAVTPPPTPVPPTPPPTPTVSGPTFTPFNSATIVDANSNSWTWAPPFP